MEKSEQLHNFDLPPKLRWRSEKNLKCMDIFNRVCEMHVVDDDKSSVSGGFDNDHGVGNVPEGFERLPKGGSDDRPPRMLSPPVQAAIHHTVIKAISGVKHEISATREKLMIEYQKDIGNLKERIKKHESIPPIKYPFKGESSSPSINSKFVFSAQPPLPPPPPPTVEGSSARIVGQRSENKSTRSRRNLNRPPKFSIAASSEEIEEDFFAMTGKKPPGKPKRRPRNVQTKLNALFPGSGLSGVHPDRYKVKENRKN